MALFERKLAPTEPIQIASRSPHLLELVTRAALTARVQAVSDKPYELILIPGVDEVGMTRVGAS